MNGMTLDEILMELARNDGACLYWQMLHPDAVLRLVEEGKLQMVDDLVIHPRAVEIKRGMAYTMEDAR